MQHDRTAPELGDRRPGQASDSLISVAPSVIGRWARTSVTPVIRLSAVMLLCGCFSARAESGSKASPQLLSCFPSIARPSVALKIEIRGTDIEDASAVWFDDGDLAGRVVKVEEVKDDFKQRINPLEKESKPTRVFRAVIELQISAKVRAGMHQLRLVSPRGVSTPIELTVVDRDVTEEAEGERQTIGQSQPAAFPGYLSGRIASLGEVDFYSFQAKKGQELQFEVLPERRVSRVGSKFAVELALYDSRSSWFDAGRPRRILFEEERQSDLMPFEVKGTYKFVEDGRYFLQVSGLFGQGCPDCTYRIRAFPKGAFDDRTLQLAGVPREWLERSMERRLSTQWTSDLEARSVKRQSEVVSEESGPSSQQEGHGQSKRPEASAATVVAVQRESETEAAAQGIAVPALVEGTIESPADSDRYKFKVAAGQRLVFEVETFDAKPPYFNPRIGVVDSEGKELFSNVERRLSMYNNNAEPQVYLKALRPKATHSFERAGEYVLTVRDITSRYGGPSYRYRILVRPQIPHVGEISIVSMANADAASEANRAGEVMHLNLARQEPRTLFLLASYEEGFNGDLLFAFTELPEGVQALPATYFSEGRGPLEVTQNADTIAPKVQKTAIVLLASPGAPLTKVPQKIQLRCQPIVDGKAGASLLVREFPLMVVDNLATPQQAANPGVAK